MSRSGFAAFERAEIQRAANIEEHHDYARRHPRIEQARFVIPGESTRPRDGYRLFDCWVRNGDGSELHQVWAHDANEARVFLLPFGGRGLTDVEEPQQ